MSRPKLMMRRFGELSFGLGYYDAGEWIDHTALAVPISEADLETDEERAAFEAIHAWFDCCRSSEPAVAGIGVTARSASS